MFLILDMLGICVLTTFGVELSVSRGDVTIGQVQGSPR